MSYYVGIDIGSTCSKTVVMDSDKKILLRHVLPTGWSSVETAENIRKMLHDNGFDKDDMLCAATGYGRISVPYANKTITEISCHGKGACYIHGTKDLTVIDIGGQDTKIISIQNGLVRDFIMNDKCSAGTGRFLEIMANVLAVKPDELCALAEKGGNATISSMCTVFAESEVISLIGKGEERNNIAFAVVDSIIRKVSAQAKKLSAASSDYCLTGGLCELPYIRKALSAALGSSVSALPDGRYAGAIGAALSVFPK